MDSIDTTNSIIGITIFGSVALSLGNLPAVALEANGVVPKLAQAITSVKINRPTLDIGSEGERVSELQAVLKLLGYYTGEVNGVYGDNTAIAVSKLQQQAGLTPHGIMGAAEWNFLFPSIPPNPTSSTSTSNPLPSASRTPPTTSDGISASSFPTPSITEAITQTTTTRPNPSSPASTTGFGNRTTTTGNAVSVERTKPSAITLPILRQGMRGPAVQQLQRRLKSLGFLKATVDGVFGEVTKAAVQAAQRKFKLEPDGIVGPATWNALLR